MNRIGNFSIMDFNVDSSVGFILVVFMADWCGPCKMLLPLLEEIHFEKNIEIYTVDVDKNPIMIGNFDIKSIPTLIFFQDGKEVDRIIGYRDKDEILEKITLLKK